MSSDEMVAGPVRTKKKLRRVRLLWLSSRVSALFEAVDSYDQTSGAGRFKQRCGVSALLREYGTVRNSTRPPVRGLPRDFYDQIWLMATSTATKADLQMRPEGSIPLHFLVSCPM